MRTKFLAVLAAVSLLAPAAASAHALLHSASPAVGSTVKQAPPELWLSFSEGVEPQFSSVEVTDAAGQRVDKGDLHTAPNDPRRVAVGLKPLPPGTYKVVWHATSVDTHKTEGSFNFTVAP